MSKVHNKKRNIGIIYEQVVQYICKNILEKNEENAKKGIELYNSFQPDLVIVDINMPMISCMEVVKYIR